MSTLKPYHPSPFDTPRNYMQIGDDYVEIIGCPEKRISWVNLALVATTAFLTMGFAMKLTGKQWWHTRTCKVRPLKIQLCTRTPSYYIASPTIHTDRDRLIDLRHSMKSQGWMLPCHLPSYFPHVTDSLTLTFIESIHHMHSDDIEQMSLQFEPPQVLFEQIALDETTPGSDRAHSLTSTKLHTAGALHGLTLCDHWAIHHPDEIESSINSHLNKQPLRGYYCLIGYTPGENDHHLITYFEKEGCHYLFNPYQGLLKLNPDTQHTASGLFSAYCQIQLQEKEVERLSLAYFEQNKARTKLLPT